MSDLGINKFEQEVCERPFWKCVDAGMRVLEFVFGWVLFGPLFLAFAGIGWVRRKMRMR